MPAREDLGTAHLDHPLGPGHPGRQAAGAWLVAQGGARARRAVAASFCRMGGDREGPRGARGPPHPLPLPPCDLGGVPTCPGQEPVGIFAYRLVSGH